MNPLWGMIVEGLPDYGPRLLFALAVLETCFVTGLVVPSGVATSVATALALQGELPLPSVLGAATAGGWVGDSLGFWIGRAGGRRMVEGRGPWARAFRRRYGELDDFFGRSPLVSVTVARLVAFVRTLMPNAAGMSGMPYARFLLYEAPGLAGWLVLYAALGVVGGESLQLLAGVMGWGGAAAFTVAVYFLWKARRRRRRRRRERA